MTGSELRALRRSRSLSRPALASMAGVHPDTVKYWEEKPAVDLRGYAPKRMLRALGVERSSHNWSIQEQRADRGFLRTNARVGWGLRPRGNLSRPKRCGALTRKGTPCRAMSLPDKTRCRFHGGASTGPRTDEGRARIAEAQRKRWAEWREARGQ